MDDLDRTSTSTISLQYFDIFYGMWHYLRNERVSIKNDGFKHLRSRDRRRNLHINVLGAGTDTIAVSLTWAMTALMRNPSAMKKVQEEIRSLVGSKGRVDEDDIEKLKYLRAVVMETVKTNEQRT
ncbi:hypothetical protein ABFX02_07G053800 [Erythranthe guttata]